MKVVGNEIKTAECCITERSGRSFVGRGKGIGDQSIASALFESIEHYRYRTEGIVPGQAIRNIDLSGYDSRLVGTSPDWRLLCAEQKVPLTRVLFSPANCSEEDLLFPAVLQNPDFEPTDESEKSAIRSHRLRRYGTNSGTAAGVGVDEAVLHGLLEIIERDALGVELLRTIVRKDPFAVRELDHHSFPCELNDLIEQAEVETGGVFQFWNLTTDLQVPSILCGLRQLSSSKQRTFFGSGASLSPRYAIERALLEAVQTYQIHELLGVHAPPILDTSASNQLLLNRCYLDAGCFGYRGAAISVGIDDVRSLLEQPETCSPEYQVELLMRNLAERSIQVYTRAISEEVIPVVQVLAPKLERFHLVSYGIAVNPGSRGRALLNS